MAWLRIDDKFARHPKLTLLTRADRWTWMEVLCYCAEYQTDGCVPKTVTEVVPRATLRFCTTAIKAGLLDVTDHGKLEVHDWAVYNPKDPLKSERQARWRRRKSDGDVDARVDGDVDGGGDAHVDPPARARARGPVPSRTPTPPRDQPLTKPNRTATETAYLDHLPGAERDGPEIETLGGHFQEELARMRENSA